MIEFVVLVLGISLFLYAFLAGADFGAGILELLPVGIERKERTELIGKAMGPVWEANHIWLILALVISFNGFPLVFWFVSEFFHFPLGALVVGIIARGASFTFMHYDPIKDGSQKFYHWIFGLSSVWCTLWIGVIIGSVMLGDYSIADQGIFERYFRHWIGPFPLSMGVFLTMLMMFNASLFLYVEAKENKAQWKRVTLIVLVTMIVAGLATHMIFYAVAPLRWKLYFLNPKSLAAIVLSAILLFPQYKMIEKGKRKTSRFLAGVQLVLIMVAGFVPLYPRLILFRDGSSLDVYQTAAEPAVIKALVIALIVGCLLILPGYYFLMKIFKSTRDPLK